MKILNIFRKRNKKECCGYTHFNSRGVKYYLNAKDVILRAGKPMRIYYFSKDFNPNTSCTLPRRFKVNENAINGFLTIRRNGESI